MGNIAIMGEQAAKVKKLLTSPEYSGADSYGKMVDGIPDELDGHRLIAGGYADNRE